MKQASIAILLAAVGLCGPSALVAQDISADPISSTVSLSAGFSGDPRRIQVTSGGSIDASALGSPCVGRISNAPDVRLHYDSGSLPLIVSVSASTDTTLVVNAPDGLWYCDDDSGEGTNPSVRFNKPASGSYEIWIGTYSDGGFNSATLHISELTSQ